MFNRITAGATATTTALTSVIAVMMIVTLSGVGAYAQTFSVPPRVEFGFERDVIGVGGHAFLGAQSVRIWGWSRNGLFAYSTERMYHGVGEWNVEFVILNIVNDRAAFELSMRGEGDVERIYAANRENISRALIQNNIVVGQQSAGGGYFPIRRFDDRGNDMVYHARLVVTTDPSVNADLYHPGVTKMSYRVVVDRARSSDGEESGYRTIAGTNQSKTIKTVDNENMLAADISGYLLSPFEPRMVVVIVEERWTFEGTEAFFRFSGCHLNAGFR